MLSMRGGRRMTGSTSLSGWIHCLRSEAHFGSVTIAAAVRLATSLNADGQSGDCLPDTAADQIAEPVGKFHR